MPAAAKLNITQLMDLWVSAGGPKAVAPMMAAIAMVESQGWPDAWNNCPHHNNMAKCSPNDDEDSRGLWQINVAPGANTEFKGWNLFNPGTNAKAAVQLYESAGFAPWYPDIASGKVNQYLPGGKGGSSAVGPDCGLTPKQKKQILDRYNSDGDWNNALTACQALTGGNYDCCTKLLGGKVGKGGVGSFNVGPSGCGPGNLLPQSICDAFGTIFADAGFAFVILGGGLLIILGLALLGIDLRKGVTVQSVTTAPVRSYRARRTNNEANENRALYDEEMASRKVQRKKDRETLKNAPNAAKRKVTRKNDFGEVPF